MRRVRFQINGQSVEQDVAPRLLLSDFLRDVLGFTGTHVGCEQGACGACTILLNGEAVRSCLMFAVQVNGATVLTIEGVSPDGTSLHPIQRAFHENHGLQCGFCTPGFVMSACALLKENPAPTESEIRTQLSGNLCRCTGYESIVQSVLQAARDLESAGGQSAGKADSHAG
ncbi:(2Fe-2S)-binding protein [Sinosporangium siamense]|uniref:(2Fe-2S)-binding protein n=1 Tax=Sinosporangium siamense TaxID=1367973 RepID=UPI001950CCC3|nr:(2Fe-2S)-binding protein [Sinosporangium siamense]